MTWVWIDNTLVTPDRSFFTVLPDGTLEIRGPGWERRKKGDPPGADRPRICRLGDPQRARRIAEMVVELVCGSNRQTLRYANTFSDTRGPVDRG